ncbi:5895_t:CDS:2, partial [Racocetra fulgida]
EVEKYARRKEYTLFHASVPKIGLYSTADTILPNVCKLLKSYLTEETRKIQEDQIVQTLHYHANHVTENEMQIFNLINLNNSNLLSGNYITITAKTLLDLINSNNVLEMWTIQHVTEKDTRHFVILLQNVVLKFEKDLSATISINQASINTNSLNALSHVHSDVTQDIKQKIIKEHRLYGEIWGKARAATLLAVRNHDRNFIEILNKYLKGHQTDQPNEQPDKQPNGQPDVEESCSESDKENIDPKDLVNPRKRKAKGRPKGTDRRRRADEPPKKKDNNRGVEFVTAWVIIEEGVVKTKIPTSVIHL